MLIPYNYFVIAVLISGLRAKGIDTCPYLIKRAMENTALYIDNIDHFSQGHGLLQVKFKIISFNKCYYEKATFF